MFTGMEGKNFWCGLFCVLARLAINKISVGVLASFARLTCFVFMSSSEARLILPGFRVSIHFDRLWMADLTITQLIQENVPERERGVIGGVQNSFNRFMDMFKFILVICLPYPETFGILIMISFIFVISGDCFYGYYSYKTRGHLLPHCGPAPVNHEPHSLHLQIVSCHP